MRLLLFGLECARIPQECLATAAASRIAKYQKGSHRRGIAITGSPLIHINDAVGPAGAN
jgi:hypothetical protein